MTLQRWLKLKAYDLFVWVEFTAADLATRLHNCNGTCERCEEIDEQTN